MREIKFRVWNGEQMISPDYIDRKGFAFWKENSIPTTSKNIMQFTGLYDKNGVDIYEGDIIEYKDNGNVYVSDRKGEVIFHKLQWCIKQLAKDTYNQRDSFTPICLNEDIFFTSRKTEVIGNIHENPDLLK